MVTPNRRCFQMSLLTIYLSVKTRLLLIEAEVFYYYISKVSVRKSSPFLNNLKPEEIKATENEIGAQSNISSSVWFG